jgi:hypothetical protein
MNRVQLARELVRIAKMVSAKPKPVDIGDSLYVHKVGYDTNGNSSVWVSKGANRAKKIQMGGVVYNKNDIMRDKLKYFEDMSDSGVKRSVKEIKDYFKSYLASSRVGSDDAWRFDIYVNDGTLLKSLLDQEQR